MFLLFKASHSTANGCRMYDKIYFNSVSMKFIGMKFIGITSKGKGKIIS